MMPEVAKQQGCADDKRGADEEVYPNHQSIGGLPGSLAVLLAVELVFEVAKGDCFLLTSGGGRGGCLSMNEVRLGRLRQRHPFGRGVNRVLHLLIGNSTAFAPTASPTANFGRFKSIPPNAFARAQKMQE